MDCLCNKNISWQGMMHACCAFDPGIYSGNVVLDILSHTPPCHLTDDSM